MRKYLGVVLLVLLLISCSSNTYKGLILVEAQEVNADETYEEPTSIAEAKTLEELIAIFKQINWEPHIDPSMERKEDVLVSLYYKSSDNTTRKRYAYRIWFNNGGTAMIISDHEKEGYGGLNKRSAKKLKKILLK
ncbi:hypothetical protein SAMN05216389_106213 [Oceanobacillus limi]|uniref:Lipoprotein n=1 Tax=Oceanobacillus limi TaxID=930131 RepID=A0A1I0CHL6_9BACI|nr:hypothetical protein [Oceanobacillus limi]SET18463.1 hypothetical protein SAMN05216389_106213 [Oceanobacillus limi]